MFAMLGISGEAERVYGELIGGSPVTVAELAGRTRLSGPVLRAALDCLESSRLIQRDPGPPPAYQVIDPAIALDVLLHAHEHELKRARAAAQELAARYRLALGSRDPAELVEVVSGREAIVDRLALIYRAARQEIRGFDKPPYAAGPGLTSYSEFEFNLIDRGGTTRVIYERAAVEMPGRLDDLELGLAHGEESRVLPELPTKLIIVDDVIALLPLQSAPEQLESSVVVHESGLLRAISALFEALWQVAMPLRLPGPAGDDQPDGPADEERRILVLMSAGLPDDVIARELGLSERTFQRRVQTMMRRLHAQTRFQLARQASLQGWLPGGELASSLSNQGSSGVAGSSAAMASASAPSRVALLNGLNSGPVPSVSSRCASATPRAGTGSGARSRSASRRIGARAAVTAAARCSGLRTTDLTTRSQLPASASLNGSATSCSARAACSRDHSGGRPAASSRSSRAPSARAPSRSMRRVVRETAPSGRSRTSTCDVMS
jgi:DNA-binding CsgD family transcriptional regulator